MFKRKRPGLSGDSTDRIVFSFKAHESGDSPSTTLSQMTSVASSTMSPPISPPTSQSPINLPKISITHTTETDCHANVKQSDEEEDSKRERLISGSSEQLDLPVEASPEYIFDQEKKMSSASSGQSTSLRTLTSLTFKSRQIFHSNKKMCVIVKKAAMSKKERTFPRSGTRYFFEERNGNALHFLWPGK